MAAAKIEAMWDQDAFGKLLRENMEKHPGSCR